MMELLIEILLDLILEGSAEVSTSKKAPMWLKAIARLILGIAFTGLIILAITMFVNGWKDQNIALTIFAGILFCIFLFGGYCFIKEIQKRMENQENKPEL